MLTHDTSVAASTIPSSTNISWDSLLKRTMEPIGNTAKIRPHRKNNKIDIASEAANQPKDDHSASKDERIRPNSEPAHIADSTPSCDPAFNFSDFNLQIRIGNRLFRIHQFKLNEFDHLRSKLEQATADDKERKMIKLQDDPDDFHNLLVVLYSSVYNFHLFSCEILKSTLKLATKYAHLILRAFVLKELEKHTLEPIDRFAISRDCGLSEWMPKALDDLCWREEPITVAEAQILGPEKFVEVAARREGIKFERGSRVNLGIAKPAQVTETVPEPSVSSRPKSEDLGNLLVASSNLLATTSTSIQPTPKEGSDSAALSHNPTSSRSSDKSGDSSSNTQPTPIPGFAKFDSKPMIFSFNPTVAIAQPKASDPSLLRSTKNTEAEGREGPTP